MFEKIIDRVVVFALNKLMAEVNKRELDECTIGIRLKKARPANADAEEKEHIVHVLALRAGTFTRSDNIKIGASVEPTDLLGHIKALEITTEVKAGISGVISELPTKKVESVEYNQRLASIKLLP